MMRMDTPFNQYRKEKSPPFLKETLLFQNKITEVF